MVCFLADSFTKKLPEGSENFLGKEERSYGSIMMERVTGNEDGRIDHSLQVGIFSSFSSESCLIVTIFASAWFSCTIF